MNEAEIFIRNATCYPYFYEPQNLVQKQPVLRYVHTILFILSITYIVISTARFFYYRRKRPVIAMLATTVGSIVLLLGNLLQPLLDLPTIYLLFPRSFVTPLIVFSVVIRVVDYYNRYILAQTLLALSQTGSDDGRIAKSQDQEQEEEGATARSEALQAAWSYLKEGQVENKLMQSRRMTSNLGVSIGNANGTTTPPNRTPKSSALEFVDVNKINDEKKRSQVTKKAIRLLKFLSSNTFYFIAFVVFALPFLIGYIVDMVKLPCYNLKYLCYSCPRPNFTIAAVVSFIMGALGLVFAFLVRKFPDPFGIVKELKLAVFFAGIPTFVAFILNARYEDGFSPYFAFGWIIGISMILLFFITVDLQIYIAKHDKSENFNIAQLRKITKENTTSIGESRLHPTSIEDANGLSAVDGLEALLRDPVEVKLFEKHLVSELAVETITMYQDCAKFVKQYYDMNENTRRARARRIIQQHVDDDALMQVNLPYQLRVDLLKKVNDPAPITITLFDEAQKEIFAMLLGSYLRYTITDLYKEAHPTFATITISGVFN